VTMDREQIIALARVAPFGWVRAIGTTPLRWLMAAEERLGLECQRRDELIRENAAIREENERLRKAVLATYNAAVAYSLMESHGDKESADRCEEVLKNSLATIYTEGQAIQDGRPR
jgi:regulator of replication initiation timing